MSTKSQSVFRRLHAVAGGVAFMLIASFWLATIAVELFGTGPQIAAVKLVIAWGLCALVPALAATGASGFKLTRGRISGKVATKFRRMKFIAANGLLVLAPSAIALAILADAGRLDGLFAVIQSIELVAGFVNLVLIGLNIRDGIRMRRPS
ncbi:hypothetical protein [Thalassospira sp.]|uniref:hypothetical protein n=1 Tax=Thalassospira sp. TaxID=1912094 RepID=UPI003AA91ABA